jgi:hypothetical protein
MTNHKVFGLRKDSATFIEALSEIRVKTIRKLNKGISFTRRLADPGLVLSRSKCRMKLMLSVNTRFDSLPYLNVIPTWPLRDMAIRSVTSPTPVTFLKVQY